MSLMQTQATIKLGRQFQGVQESDLNRDDMKKMLEKLPKDDTANIAKEPGHIAKQLQTRTQKIDLHSCAQESMEGQFDKVKRQKILTRESSGQKQFQKSHLKFKICDSLLQKQLQAGRVGQEVRPGIHEHSKSSQKHTINFDKQSTHELNDELLFSGGQNMDQKFKAHRKSNGLDFIDIRREINAEMKRVSGQKSPQGVSDSRPRIQGKEGSNLRCINDLNQTGQQDQLENSILLGSKSLRGSRSHRQVIMGGNQIAKSSTPALNANNVNADLNVARLSTKDSQVFQKWQNHLKVFKPNQVNMIALRTKTTAGAQEKRGPTGLLEAQQSIYSERITLKKEKIRKFMLRKQKQKQEEEERTRRDQIQKTLKVHENLTNLDKYAKKKLKVVQGGGDSRTNKKSANTVTLRPKNQLVLRKNITSVQRDREEPDCDDQQENDQILTITPSKTVNHVNEPIFNISAKLMQRSSGKKLKRMTKATLLKDATNSDRKNIQIDSSVSAALIEHRQLTNNATDSLAFNQHEKSFQIRPNNEQQNTALKSSFNQQHAPQFENSASAKALRAPIRNNQYSPTQNQDVPIIVQAPSITLAKGRHVQRRASNAQVKIIKPSQVTITNLAGQQPKLQKKIKSSGRQQKKRGRSANKQSTGGDCNIQLKKKITGFLKSEGSTYPAKIKTTQSSNNSNEISKKNQHFIIVHNFHPQNLSLNRTSDQKFKSDHHIHQPVTTHLRRRMQHKRASVELLDRELAAKIIQKEVRKYLKFIGFYQARQLDSNAIDTSHEPINLFIQKKSRSRSHSRKSKQSNSRSGSRGHRQKNQNSSRQNSPNPRSIQETTIIAQLSGLKKTDLFYSVDEGASEDPNSKSAGESRQITLSRVYNNLEQRPQKKILRTDPDSSNKKPGPYKEVQIQLQKSHIQRPQPNKKLSPVLIQDLDQDFEGKKGTLGLHDDLLQQNFSVPTPQQRASNPMVKRNPKQQLLKLEKSFSANHVGTDSEFEQKQAHSSMDSNSFEKLSVIVGQNGQLYNDVVSHSSNSLFDRNAFQQYSQKRLRHIMEDSEHSKLIKIREDYLNYKERRERRHIKQLFKQNQVSPRSFQLKKKQIDRWVQVQRQDIEKSKTTFKEEWDKTIQMIEETQKNVDHIKHKMLQAAPISTHHSINEVMSARDSSVKGNTGDKILKNSNLQPFNSINSHRIHQISTSSKKPSVQLPLSGLGEHQRSVLIDDPPKSYRSGHKDVFQIQLPPNPNKASILAQSQANSTKNISSNRSGSGSGENLNKAAAKLLKYMEKRCEDHNTEQKKSDLDNDLTHEEELKRAMDLVEKQLDPDGTNLQLPRDRKNNIASTQNTIELGLLLEKENSLHQDSVASAIESEEISHRPSAEFLERLERVYQIQPDPIGDNLLGSGEFSGILAKNDGTPNRVNGQEDFNNGDEEDNQQDKESFKTNEIILQEIDGVDSQKPQQLLEKSDVQLLSPNQETEKAKSNDPEDEKELQPSPEHLLDEPSVIGRRMNLEQTLNTSAEKVKSASPEVKPQPEPTVNEAGEHLISTFLQEPAIISSSQSLEIPDDTPDKISSQQLDSGAIDPENPHLVTAKVRSNKELKTMKLDQICALFSDKADPEQIKKKDNVIDVITEKLMKDLLKDAVTISGRGKDAKQGSSDSDAQQQQIHDVYIIDQLQSEKEERKEWIELRQRHLVENDLIRIDQYVNEIVDALLQFDIDISFEDDEDLSESQREARERELKANYHIQFLKQLTQPIQKSSSDMLKILQTSQIGSYKHFETTQDLQKHPIIPISLYLDIEKAREEALMARKSNNMSKQTQIMWESIHITNKSFFDSINESLMKFRPYGLTGEPMPWSNKIRRLQTKVDIGSVDTERLFQMIKQEVFRWSQAFCGAIPSSIFCFTTPQNREKEEFNDELFQENREKRLTQVLQAETIEQEHHWLNYEYEEAQVKIDLSDMILENLLEEIVVFLSEKSGIDIEEVIATKEKSNKKNEKEETLSPTQAKKKSDSV